MTRKRASLFRLGLGLGVGGLALALPLATQAIELNFGEVTGSIDTTVSAGALWRMDDRERALIAISNGGTGRSAIGDDGNINYEKGDLVSAAIKATNDLELKYGSVGLFNRVTTFYDFQAKSDEDFFGKRGRDRLVSEFDFLDAFVYANFKINGKGATARVGKQVVNWGESTFIGNSLNTINPVDVAKLRTPGSEIKEALLPIPMFWGSAALSDSLSAEALWIWSYQETQIDPRGSFFSTNDFVSDDGDGAFAGAGRRNDQHGFTPVSPGTAAVRLLRAQDRRPEGETQQYGFALRYFAEAINSTEFGLYYLKYHSRVPFVSAQRATAVGALATGRYFADYPEDIELMGLSFNTAGPLGIALQGEYSYRPNLPLQIAALDLFAAALRLPGNTYDRAAGVNSGTAPTLLDGYQRVHAHQAQTTGTKAFGPTLGAQQFVTIVEAGVTFLDLDQDFQFAGPGTDLPSCSNPTAPVNIINALGNGSCQERVGGGYADRTSWGYRALARMDFESVFGSAAQLSPRLVFAHDVNGVGPAFNQEAKAITVGLGMNYLQRWQADIGYTAFFDGRHYKGGAETGELPPGAAVGDANQSQSFETSANPNEDRDFLAVSVSYAF